DGSVRPDGFITRAEAAVILFRLLNDPNKYAQAPLAFSDVDHNSWFSQGVNYLAHLGVLRGYQDGTFRPNAPISRAEFSALVTRFFGAIEAPAHNFTDVLANHWATSYINMAFARGWITGYHDGTFRPSNSITRAEVVVLINRVLGRQPNAATIDAALDGALIFNDITPQHWAFYHMMEASISHNFTIDADGQEIWTEFTLPR
ncbi:MAG: S-layer homology domain-containing protein, partial [Defluviitaleaceae bacterium]|nr:S-layer homology domain-containing protein [Defluviitaleaceae bacterium]